MTTSKTLKPQNPLTTSAIALASKWSDELEAEDTIKITDQFSVIEYPEYDEMQKDGKTVKTYQRVALVIRNEDKELQFGLEGGNLATIGQQVPPIVTVELMRIGWAEQAMEVSALWETYKSSGNAGKSAKLTRDYTNAISTTEGRELLAKLATQINATSGSKVALIFQVASNGETILIGIKPSNERANSIASKVWDVDYKRVGYIPEVRTRTKTQPK